MSKTVRWEYLEVKHSNGPDVPVLNRYGAEGWQLCAVVHLGITVFFYFKRVFKKERE
jgi:hypothetical protein